MALILTWLSAFATICIPGAYEAYFLYAQARKPEQLARSAHATMREDWLIAHSETKGTEIIVVQTIRNAVMAATLTASTSALGLIGTVTISATALHETFGANGAATPALTPRLVLELVLLAMLFASMVSSMMAVRFYNHAGFIGGMPVESAQRRRWNEVGVKYVRRAGVLYSWGLRHLVVVAPILASILHPASGPFAAVLIVAVLLHFDRVAARGHER
jgi:Protein of unknown function, DUF599